MTTTEEEISAGMKAKKLTLADLMKEKLNFYLSEQRRLKHPENRMAYEVVIATLIHLLKVEEAQRKEWAKRLRKSIPIAGKRKERYSIILGVIAELEAEERVKE